MQSFVQAASCRALGQGLPHIARSWQWPGASRLFSATAAGPEEPAAAPAAEAGASDAGASTSVSSNAIDHSIVDDAMSRINMNTALKTEALSAHGVGIVKAMERQQTLRLGMLLTARRKAIREGREGKAYAGMLVSDALRKSTAKRA